ncbi:MAG: hypothetical protein ABI723_25455 [Bacteroidia bacterium]
MQIHKPCNLFIKVHSLLLIILAVCTTAKAQTWTSIGPGGGGQVRAVFLDEKNDSTSDLYVGSDVAGIWKVTALTDISNFSQYQTKQYSYISDHEIMRFINKFYKPSTYSSKYLFVGNSSGIHRLDRTVTDGAIKRILDFPGSWVSDLYISDTYNGYHRIYFSTGNTRVLDDNGKNKKDNTTKDFYFGTLDSSETIVSVTGVTLLGLNGDRDIFCMYADEKVIGTQSDDDFYLGTENGLYHFNYSDAVKNSIPSVPINGPIPGTSYKVTSITRPYTTSPANNFLLITVNGTSGAGVYLFNKTDSTWGTALGTTFVGKKNQNDLLTHVFDTSSVQNFTRLLTIQSAGVPTGFLLFNESPNTLFGTQRYTTGVFYCGIDSNNQPGFIVPAGNWISLNTNYATSDLGWNSSTLCANPNSAFLSNNNTLIVGKSGNLFVGKQPTTNVVNTSWQQIYTSTVTLPGLCAPSTSYKSYHNIGFVNTNSKCIYPDAFNTNRIWIGDYDRFIWASGDSAASSFTQLKPNPDTDDICISLNTPSSTIQPCAGTPQSLADCSFITNNIYDSNDHSIYTGLSEGFSINKGRGFILKYDSVNTNNSFIMVGDILCGDPLKLLCDHSGRKYALVRNSANDEDRLYYLDGSTWTQFNLWNGVDEDIADALIDPNDDLYVIKTKGSTVPYKMGVYRFTSTANPTIWSSAGSALAGKSCNELATYKDTADNNYLICGTRNNGTTTNLLKLRLDTGVLVSSNINSCNSTPEGANIFKLLSSDGVTSISINQSTHTVYVGTVKFDSTLMADRSHFFKGGYNVNTGDVISCWTEITGDLPNALITSSSHKHVATGQEILYSTVNGHGEWKKDVCSLNLTLSKTNATCNGSANGNITANPTCGYEFGGYKYLWSTSPAKTTKTITGLAAGTYTVTVTDATGLSVSQSATITQPDLLSISVNLQNAVCKGSSSFTIPYTSTTGSPDRYTLKTDATGHVMTGFTNIVNATLTGSPISALMPTATLAGTYNFKLTVANSANTTCTSQTYNIVIVVNDPPTANAGIDIHACVTGPINLNGTTGGGAIGGHWLGGAGVFTPGRNTLNANYSPAASEAGTIVTLTLVSDQVAGSACPSATDDVKLTIDDIPTANAGSDQTICDVNTVTLSGSITGGINSGVWSTAGDGTFNNTSALNAVYTPGTNDKLNGSVLLTLTPNAAGVCPVSSDNVLITINHANSGDTTATACNSFTWYGNTYNASGTPTHTFMNISGCDSVVMLHLTINYSNAGDTIATACNSFTWYDSTYTVSTLATHLFNNAVGCDSIVTLHLTINYSNSGDTIATACNSFTWYGSTYTASTSATHLFTNVSGCDSTVTLHLTINYSNTGDTTTTACNSFTWYDSTYTASTLATHLFTNADGCDSTVTLHLTINYNYTGDTIATACNSFVWYDSTYTVSTLATHLFTNAAGCDSTVTLHLTINYSNTGDTIATACNSFTWYDSTYSASTSATHLFTNAVGCDSLVTLHLSINYSNTADTIATACNSFIWYDSTYTASTLATHLFTNVAGCDSTVTLHLTINYSNTGDTIAIACNSFTWYGITYTTSTLATHLFTNAVGCDSIVTLHLTINYSNTGDTTVTACNSFTWYDSTYTASTLATHLFTNAVGCDSTVTLHLTINYSNTGDTTATACNSFTWYDSTYTASTSATHLFTNVSGCDSTVTLHLTINYSNTSDTIATACNSFIWYDSTYTVSTLATHLFTNAVGCDSTVTLHLTINYSNTGDTIATACNSFTWYGITYTTSTLATHLFTNAIGCDSTVTLHLTINYSNTGDTIATACNSFTWYDSTYTVSTLATHLLTNVVGCDSTVTLHLTINNCSSTLSLTAFLEGYYLGGGVMASTLYDLGLSTDPTATDTIEINLWNPSNLSNANPDYSYKTILHNNGSAFISLGGLTGNYYIAVKHRNSIETWSANPVNFAASTSYNFTNSLSKAYDDGINFPMKIMGSGVFAFYGGDVSKDGTVDSQDMQAVDNDAGIFAFGYNDSDCTGDGGTDSQDMQIIDNNSQLFLFYARPY